ncbi:Histone chaperone [Komagataella phaffii CBS 7435]|uniref:Histone chaperone RTT106 n=2 Tax=Komagataella phaffii TaxID=460519 RepID=C4R4T9_KOMPG|nr:Protein with a role in regulation of Ty1 transposition [Komagataella phaffii GS115]AOA64030.1 GQ67_03598T0 [Komagataella phaffii]CAH2449663.1 Histone chaperone [Komagataella phaffii CBS 7435]AOA69067.1 GQ68_03569T0 [Komagataella phaffii GS115]CAY70575.1 Protein with a role in regulation of Ty1 transposition [Komagataella phaffii GS115]CCA39636.1 Histone chaperone [Komagataella phaffii CBS 7435]
MENLPSNLSEQIKNLIEKYPETENVFNQLIDLVDEGTLKEAKRVKISNEINFADYTVILQLPSLSVQSPFRSKSNLIFACPKSDTSKPILAIAKTNEKPQLILDKLNDENVLYAVILPIPEKKDFKNLAIFYKENMGGVHKNEPLLIQYNESLISESLKLILQKMTFPTYFQRQCSMLGFKLNLFTESKDFYVVAHKGSKEGFLYFLEDQILFGFKKPILLFEKSQIESINYSSVTRLTFSITLSYKEADKTAKIEFSMIDQAEFDKIDNYVKAKGFTDKSLTEELKAKSNMKNNETSGALREAALQIPGGEKIVGESNIEVQGDSDDEDVDGTYQFNGNESEDDGSPPNTDEETEEKGDDAKEDDLNQEAIKIDN